MSVHYKFKSSLDYDTVTFDGLHISVGDLKKSIIQQKKIGKSSDFDLQITNAQTKEVYKDDETLIPKNSSVVVARVPIPGASKKMWDRSDSASQLVNARSNDPSSDGVMFDKLAKTADLTALNASEDDKIKAMMSQATQDYDPSKYMKIRGMTGPLPPNYLCFRCGKPGHWIKNCPTNIFEVKRSTGIPRSFMVTVEGPEVPGALLTNTGQFAVPVIDHEAYREGKKERPPFAKDPTPEKEVELVIPEELVCMICRDLLSDAVLIPCCGNSYCDECVRQALLDSEEHECPTCHEKDISPDTLIPNRFLRTAVMNFKNETGYTKVKKIVKAAVVVPPVVVPAAVPATVPATVPVIETPAPPPPAAQITEEPIETEPPVPPGASDNSPSIADDRPGTPVRDEHPDVAVSVPVLANTFKKPTTSVIDSTEPPGETLPLPPTSLPPSKQSCFSISTITTRTSRHNYPPVMTPLLPYRQTRPIRGSSHYSEAPPPLRGGVQPLRRPFSPKRDMTPHYHHHHHHHSRHGYNPPSHGFGPMPPQHGNLPPPTSGPPPLLSQPLLPLPPPHLPHHFAHGQMPPGRGMPPRGPPPRGPPPPGYPSQPPPPGAVPLGPYEQPPPPGIPLPSLHGSQHGGNFNEFYRDHKSLREKDRPKNPFDEFERELMEYKSDHNLRTRNSRSSSRSFASSRSSSRSRSHSLSRSLSQSSRSRSRSVSYSRSRSSSGSRSRSRSRSRSPYRPRTRSRGKHYSPHYRHSRSPFGRTRSPFRRDYSPSYYNMYRYQAPISSNYSPDNRGRYYQHSYRYEDYHHYPDHRYNAQEDPQYSARYDCNRYEDSYHDKQRSWTPEEREKMRHDARKGMRMPDYPRKEEDPRSLQGGKEAEGKKGMKRHHRSKVKKEHESRSKEVKTRKDEGKLDLEGKDGKTAEKEDARKSHGVKKVEMEPEPKVREKRHKAKSKKDAVKVKIKSEKKGDILEKKSPRKQLQHQQQLQQQQQQHLHLQQQHHLQQQQQQHERKQQQQQQQQRANEPEEEGNVLVVPPAPVNPNIIVIKTDPELKMKHVIKEADSTNNLPVVDSTVEEDKRRDDPGIKGTPEPDSVCEMDAGKEEEEFAFEEEDGDKGEIVEPKGVNDSDEPVLTAQIPELSKWEREESDVDETVGLHEERMTSPQQKTTTLPRDIVQRAEKALLHKPMKPSVAVNETGKKIVEKKGKAREKSSPKYQSPEETTLQITISGQEGRSVETRGGAAKEEYEDEMKGKNDKVKLDRSKFRESEKSPVRTGHSVEKSSTGRKDDVRAVEKPRENVRRDRGKMPEVIPGHWPRHDLEQGRRFERYGHEDANPWGSKGDERGKRNVVPEGAMKKKSESERECDSKERAHRNLQNRVRMKDTFTEVKRLPDDRGREKSIRGDRSSEAKDEHRRERRKSTIDESKFEPNYDELSDSEMENDERKKLAKRMSSPLSVGSTKRARKEDSLPEEEGGAVKRERSSSSSSSVSPSSVRSVSQSPQRLSASEKHKHKKSKHKKHRKHKHKHRKKKSHKSSKHAREKSSPVKH